MILDFTDKNKVRRLIDINQVISVVYNPDYDNRSGRVAFYLNGGHTIAFAPPEDMDMDLILAGVTNNMKRRGNK